MSKNRFARLRATTMTICAIAIATLAVVDGTAIAKNRKQREDARTCAGFGLRYGSPAYSKCMLEQQRRRDFKVRDDLEKMAITSQIAKDGQIMAERARRQRCARNPDRRECGR